MFVEGVAGVRTITSQRQKSVPSVAHRLPYFVPPMPAVVRPRRHEENPYESVPVLGPLQHYTSQSRGGTNNKEKSRKSTMERYAKYSQYGPSEYYGIHQDQENPTAVYTQVGGEYSDTYSQPTDRLYNEEKYAQPVYYTPRDPDQISSGRLYQGQPDSSFGSDSGYSHHTSGTTGTNGTRGSIQRNNYRKDNHRNSHHSHHSTDYIVS